ncbi:enoyl-CoA hydratase/carnithine racemase [Nocardioides luteus]|uniref:Enoyl-CoA hydratase/isomerase family protein n=1 Tax=Nocardioides luteus TaxID=1844 RepID=A0ABQ5SX91_9ACTN|nr:crotonase/enoyl-CoA hydratase family protein [Nocardioides luteus]MDR7312525.1 enoyl-CoA hydratase/carnithine racemase [Nocardioides luteus]GGR45746.1 enoyl-CoA hydratase/isomerase family protein [Nocardioides luteus]GLJ68773.1 enoyl-CoA hydratase/isomerase family protein [Nocardioides luteus]
MPLVTTEINDGIAQVRLNRPEKLNALTLDLLRELVATAKELRKNRDLRAVVIAGEGDAFTAGLDFASVLRDPKKIVGAFTPVPFRGTNLFQESVWAWRRLPVPVIAAVHGHCLGGGVQIALGADFRIAEPDSQWSVLEGKWGIIPDMTGIRSLSEVVGLDTAKKLTMTAEQFSGERAYELGLVTELSADPVATATAFARKLSERSPDQLAAAKRLFNDTWYAPIKRTFSRERIEQLRLLFGENTKIAREAAFKREKPTYKPRR